VNGRRQSGIKGEVMNNSYYATQTTMKKISTILTLLLSISFASTAQELLPTSRTHQIVRHTYYTLSYSEPNEQAEWVYYELTADMVRGKQKRTDDYRPDEKVSTVSAQLEDYMDSGYDRGHLCPAGDMKINLTAMTESFYLSNMSPQKKEFNDGIWNELEEKVRRWALSSGRIYVVTGGVLTSNKGKIGMDGVTIPKYFYKVIYDPIGQGEMVAFLIPNEKSTKPLQTYVVSVDSVESLTGIDFFPELPDTIASRLESGKDFSRWHF
jgi:endonuclease G, mitochondrial